MGCVTTLVEAGGDEMEGGGRVRSILRCTHVSVCLSDLKMEGCHMLMNDVALLTALGVQILDDF